MHLCHVLCIALVGAALPITFGQDAWDDIYIPHLGRYASGGNPSTSSNILDCKKECLNMDGCVSLDWYTTGAPNGVKCQLHMGSEPALAEQSGVDHYELIQADTEPAPTEAAQDAWITFDGIGQYQFIVQAPSWHDSVAHCNSIGGYLAVVGSQEENDAIISYLESHEDELNLLTTNGRVWIGGSELANPGTWIWEETGEEITYENWDRERNQPNNGQGVQHCTAYYYQERQWDDDNCDSGHTAMICERDVSVADPWITFDGIGRYQFIVEAPSWHDSVAHCNSIGGYLAVVGSQEENDAIISYLESHEDELNLLTTNGRVWIGGSELANPGTWIWEETGEEITYENWDRERNQPNNSQGVQHCTAYYYRERQWDDDNCDSNHTAMICERDL